MDNYENFEKNIREIFSAKFNEYEQQRIKENLKYKVKSFLYFVLIPLILCCIVIPFVSAPILLLILFLIVFLIPIFIRNLAYEVIPFILLFVTGFLFHYNLNFLIFVLHFALLITADILIFLNYKTRCNKNFMNKIKEQNMYEIIKSISNLKWFGHDIDKDKSNSIISDATIHNSGLFLSYNTRYIDDEFQGTYKDVPFNISETKLYDHTKSSKSESKTKIFQGVIIKFKANKTVKDRTIVSTKRNFTLQNEFWFALLFFSLLEIFFIFTFPHGLKDPTFPLICKIMLPVCIIAFPIIMFKAYKKQKEMFKKINLEDSDFEKIFDVYSSDQVESRYLITPTFMERFKNIQTSFGAKIIKCSFYNDDFMVAITTNKNLFEIGSLFDSFNDTKILKQFFYELESIYKMIEYLKLNEKTGI